MAKKWMSSSDRAQRIVDAVKELHEACYDAWDKDDDVAFRAAYAVLKDMERITLRDGDEIEGWSGGCIKQADAVVAGLAVLEDSYDADKKT
jgi:hypothetical protein